MLTQRRIEKRRYSWLERIVPWIAGTLLLIAVLVAVVFAAARSNATPVLGTWVGRGHAGQSVLYHFDRQGHGYRVSGGDREPFRYQLRTGYPNLIRVRFGADPETPEVEGLVRLAEGTLWLELPAPGQPAPRQLGPDALELRRPASR